MSQTPPEIPEAQALRRAGLLPPRTGGYLDSSEAEIQRVVDFFEAAADFWECAPWEVLSCEEILHVEGLGPAPLLLSVCGGEEDEVPGLLVRPLESGPALPEAGQVAFHFVPTEALGEALPAEIRTHGFRLAHPEAVPVAFREGCAGLASPADLSSLVRCMHVILAFLKAGLDEQESVERQALSLPDRGRVLVTWKEADPFASRPGPRPSAPKRPETLPEAEKPKTSPIRHDPRPGRNEPCWCGSGQKYKKCHLDEDRRRDSEALRHGGGPVSSPG